MKTPILFFTVVMVWFSAGSAFSQNQSDMNINVSKLDIENATFDDVLAVFGEPLSLVWGNEKFSMDNRPEYFIARYPKDFGVLIGNERVCELRFTNNEAGYIFDGKLRIGSPMETVLEVLGQPKRIVEGEKIAFKEAVLYKDAEGMKGSGYYCRSDKGQTGSQLPGKSVAQDVRFLWWPNQR